jgi:hypothetical protein
MGSLGPARLTVLVSVPTKRVKIPSAHGQKPTKRVSGVKICVLYNYGRVCHGGITCSCSWFAVESAEIHVAS